MASLVTKGSAIFGVASSKSVIVGFAQPRFLQPTGQVADGSTLKEVKARIKSVQSIRKITKTMNMIATARLRAAQGRMERARVFYSTISGAFDNVPPVEAPKKTLLVPITSDRGLCGAVNTNIVKQTKSIMKDRQEKGAAINMVCIGEKGPTQLARESAEKIVWSAGETARRSINFLAASTLVDKISELEWDSAEVIYNRFVTVITYNTTVKEIPSYNNLVNRLEVFDQYEFEDDNSLFHLQDLTEYHFASCLFSSFADSQSSELGGRMSSMDNATKNAGEMIKRLSIEYNRRRQAAITTELNEIISGASAIA